MARYGRARISASNVEPRGICDRCGFCYSLSDLRWQYQWAGTELRNTQFRVCSTCLDVPNQQLRAIVIPPDPVPVRNPRPDLNATLTNDDGQYYPVGNFLCTEDGQALLTQDGQELLAQYELTPADIDGSVSDVSALLALVRRQQAELNDLYP